jgi:glycosyltransferase involved in cell wall biosynthesis
MEQLPQYISRASVCLGGHFSLLPKAARVISTKTFQFLAMRKPTIVGDNPATRELFTPGEDICVVLMGDASALAQAIETLADDPGLRQRIALGGYNVVQKVSTFSIGERLAAIIENLS